MGYVGGRYRTAWALLQRAAISPTGDSFARRKNLNSLSSLNKAFFKNSTQLKKGKVRYHVPPSSL